MNIAVFVGSLREKSSNKMLAKALEDVAPGDVHFQYIDIRVPLYSEDAETAATPEVVQKMKQLVEAADGVLFMTPEYNRSIPGVLKNAIDWASRPYGQSSFANKPVGIVGSSMGPIGTAVAQADLRRVMLFQNAKVLGQPEVYVMNAYEVFDEAGKLQSDRWRKNLREYMDAFMAWVNNK